MSLFSTYTVLSFAYVRLYIAIFISYYLSTYELERDSENYRTMYDTVPYRTIRYLTGGNSPMGTGLRWGHRIKWKVVPIGNLATWHALNDFLPWGRFRPLRLFHRCHKIYQTLDGNLLLLPLNLRGMTGVFLSLSLSLTRARACALSLSLLLSLCCVVRGALEQEQPHWRKQEQHQPQR